MAAKQVVPGVYRVSLGVVNAYLIADGIKLVLVDTGMPGSQHKILRAVRELGRQPQDVAQILITHLHADHTGALAALKEATGAAVSAHPKTAAAIREGVNMRPVQPAPGWANQLMYKLMGNQVQMQTEPTPVEYEVSDGETLPFAGGIDVLHTPGHTMGHTVYLWPQQGGVLFTGDAVSAMFGLGYPPIFEDLELGQQTLTALVKRDFQVLCPAHGSPITRKAAARLRAKWG